MNKLALAVASVLVTGASASFAQNYYPNAPRDPYYASRDYDRTNDGYQETARVLDVRPLEAREARHECYNPRAGVFEEVREENRTRIGKGAAAGAVVGGVLGHQVDQGGGTAAGAILGGILGHHLERRNDRVTQDDLDYSRCRTLAGGSAAYEVRYAYQGREYTTYMNHDPGRRLRIGVDTRQDGSPLENVAQWDPAYSGG